MTIRIIYICSVSGLYETCKLKKKKLVQQQCYLTVKQLARIVFVQNIKPKLPMEMEALQAEIDRTLEGLISCGKRIILRPSTTYSKDIAVRI